MIPTYTVHALRLGTMRIPKGSAVLGAGPEIIQLPVWCAAIEGGGRRLLVDTGIRDTEKWQQLAPHAFEETETLEGRLAELGWTTRDVEIVVNSHLHYDHSEGNLTFPHAQFYVSQTEWAWAADPSSAQEVLYDVDWTGPEVSHLNYTLISTDDYDVLPGVRVIQTPGHTPGHQSVLVKTAEGVLCVTGDAACLMESLTGPIAPGTHVGTRAALDSIDKICRLSDRILMNHDPELSQFQHEGFPEAPPAWRPG